MELVILEAAGGLDAVVNGFVHRETDLSARVDQAGIDEDLERLAGQVDFDPILAARIGSPGSLGHQLIAPGEVVNEVEIRFGMSREDEKVLRHTIELLDEGSRRGKRRRSADDLAVRQCDVLASVIAPNLIAEPLILSPIESGFFLVGRQVHGSPSNALGSTFSR